MAEEKALPQVLIYTDGGCDPNPGPGGWGAVLVWDIRTKEISGAEPDTTNNRMELTAAIEALRQLRRPCEVVLCTDSQYLRKGITQWLAAWQDNGWRKANGRPVENADLWQELVRVVQPHKLEWRWIRGHRGNPLNERADQLAREARERLLRGETPTLNTPKGGRKRTGELPQVDIYARGCALGAPGPGGYAAVLVFAPDRVQVVSGASPSATIGNLELGAVILGLRALERPHRVTLHAPSKYIFDGATKWLADWERNGWRTKDGQPVKHQALWMELIRAVGDHDITWKSPSRLVQDPHSRRAAEVARGEAERAKTQT